MQQFALGDAAELIRTQVQADFAQRPGAELAAQFQVHRACGDVRVRFQPALQPGAGIELFAAQLPAPIPAGHLRGVAVHIQMDFGGAAEGLRQSCLGVDGETAELPLRADLVQRHGDGALGQHAGLDDQGAAFETDQREAAQFRHDLRRRHAGAVGVLRFQAEATHAEPTVLGTDQVQGQPRQLDPIWPPICRQHPVQPYAQTHGFGAQSGHAGVRIKQHHPVQI